MSPYELPGQLVQAHEDIFFGYEFATQAGQGKRLSDDVIHYYVRSFSNREALRSRFGLYWGLDTTVAQKRSSARPGCLRRPSWRSAERQATVRTQLVADDVQTVVTPGIGH